MRPANFHVFGTFVLHFLSKAENVAIRQRYLHKVILKAINFALTISIFVSKQIIKQIKGAKRNAINKMQLLASLEMKNRWTDHYHS